MKLYYETPRLHLHILTSEDADRVLDFLQRNKTTFDPYEAAKVPAYYTLHYQSLTLKNEFQAFLAKRYVRFYASTAEQPDKIIGTVSFNNIRPMPYCDAIIGYKFDQEHLGQGYATEAVGHCIHIMFQEFNLHRLEALVMPQNTSSIRLLERLYFICEGTASKIIKIEDEWKDHIRYVLFNPALLY